ncbi:MAG: hypothetical protein NWF07_05980, partial [Candidatus Bathyarchaeota archaeon]|nr:hypothetical protein [Candidatus Bathyarchaeota archaeon]
YGQQIEGFVSYYSEDTYEGWDMIFEKRFNGTITELYSLGQRISSYEPIDIGGEPIYFSAGIQYNVSTGMPIWSYGVGLCDDITALMTGMEFTPTVVMKDGKEDSLAFTLVEENMIPYEYMVEGVERSASTLYYTLVLLIVLLVIAGVVVYKRG